MEDKEKINKVIEHIYTVANDNDRFLNAEEEKIISILTKNNYYQVIEGSEMYYPWYVHKLENDIKVLRKLLEWAEECDFGFDNIITDLDEYNKFCKETNDMNYLDSMIYYTERWMDENEPGWRS